MSQKIRDAIRECLNRCRTRGDVAAFTRELEGKAGWTEDEIRALTARVLRFLDRSSPDDRAA
jgi:hypothetical protein